MNFNTVIVQAGGKGTRMQHLTKNKPKALVPINNLPMIFHLFRKYPNKKFVVIGDYKCDVLERYLAAFAEVDYCVVNAGGKVGTCGGLNKALECIKENESFMLIWSDLILNEDLDLSDIPAGNYVGCSLGFECRWKYENGLFEEERSSTCGVAGMFLFENKGVLAEVPEEGEFVRWLSSKNIDFGTVTLDRTKEYGLLSEYNKLQAQKCRPFNRITVEDDCIVKEGIDAQGRQLAKREVAWYEKVKELGFKNLPVIHELEPLKLEKIDGKNIYEYAELPCEKKKDILIQLVDCLNGLHKLGEVPFDAASYDDAYLGKTFARLEKVKELVPFAKDEFVIVNGKRCRNVFGYEEKLREMFEKYKPDKFVFLHGDCTFSNLMLRHDLEPVLIDPRGYFGKTELYGDAAYDWAKLYYSIVGNYDQFNLKRFSLEIGENEVTINTESSGWEELKEFFFELLKDEIVPEQIKLIHAIIWLSLTTYAWEDYDSICGAFYLGLFYLEDVL
ncbi:MAG: phosphotransferase [Lachnospiraceae bacterium]|nr:phosphotransferase [Lachnospiraceae bacterium]